MATQTATPLVTPFPREDLRLARYQFTLPIQTPYELGMFLRCAFGISMPDRRVCPNHATPWEAFCTAYFGWAPVVVIKASRGFGGKSHWNAVLALTEAITLRADVNILGGSGSQSRNVHESLRELWHHPSAPRELGDSDIMRETRLRNGARVRALLASQRAVRGPHPQRLRLDEIDEMDLAILDASLGQPMPKHGVESQVSMSSTHQYADGTMTEILKRARDKGWPVFEWCWRETEEPHGWLPTAAIARKRAEVTEAMWEVEYDLQEPAPGERAIAPECVRRAFQTELGDFEGRERELCEVGTPREGRFAHGADWARKVDKTALVTIRSDVHPMEVVAFERFNRVPWPQTLERYESRIAKWGGRRSLACHDAGGIGDVVEGFSREEIIGVILAGRRRSDIFTEYVKAIESGDLVWPMIRSAYGEHLYASVDDCFRTGGHPPDTFVAGALAYHAAKMQVEDSQAVGAPQSVGSRTPMRIGGTRQ